MKKIIKKWLGITKLEERTTNQHKELDLMGGFIVDHESEIIRIKKALEQIGEEINK